jgi:hypothetical protein
MRLLSGCTNGRYLLLPDRQNPKFACDMDPYKQGCERRSDYDRHFDSVDARKARGYKTVAL